MHSLFARTTLATSLASILSCATADAAAARIVTASQPSLTQLNAARGASGELMLQAGVFDPASERLDAGAIGAAADVPTDYAIVQFKPGQTHERKRLAQRGVQFLGYVPNNAYYVRLNGLAVDALKEFAAVRWAGQVRPGMKLDPRLWLGRRIDSAAKQPGGEYQIRLDAFAGASSDTIAAALRKAVPGVRITQTSLRPDAPPYVRAAIDSAHLDALLSAATAIEGVVYVSPWVQPQLKNSGAIGAIQGDASGNCAGSGTVCGPTPIWDHGLFGSGQVVAISDSGTDANEAWFATLDKGAGPHTEITQADDPPPLPPALGTLRADNKILAYWVQPGATAYDNNETCPGGNGSSTSFHGTHTSGTLVGDAAGTFNGVTYLASTPTAANHELADGMAPNAQLIQQDIGNDESGCLAINDLVGTLQQALAAGAHIHSDSWGGPGDGRYGADDNSVDYVTSRDESLLVVIAAGNDGAGAMTTGSPGNAKNALTVGALGHAGSKTVASFSSRGPTADGRQKPDIMAPGVGVISAAGDASTTTTIEAPLTKSLQGTSMATPTIAGNAVLMRQFFAEGFYPRGEKTAADVSNPSGAMLKAVLLNGTDPVQPTTWPNGDIGWGRAWLDGNLWFKQTMPNGDDSRRLRLFERPNAAGLATGESDEYAIEAVGAGVEFRVTLTWFDAEAAPGAASTLVNDLDLEVVGPDGQTYLGNHFSSGVSSAGGTPDTVNTVEQARFTAPAAGRYVLRVKASNVPGNGLRENTDRQGYALAASGAFGLPDGAALPAPTALSIAGNDASGIRIGFTGSAGAQGYQLYRADGTCASAQPGNFHMVATGAASPLVDDHSQGTQSYAYKLRGVQNDVEGDASACVDVVSADTCTFEPTLDLHSLASTDTENATCSVQLAWSAAHPNCSTASGVHYMLERDTDPYFAHPQTLTSTAQTTSYTDTGVSDGSAYFYRVTAIDDLGNTSPTSNTASATPSGAGGPDPSAFLDDVDNRSYMTMEAPWAISRAAAGDGSYSYSTQGDLLYYADRLCGAIRTPPLTIAAGATTLGFQAKYDLEYQWDGVALEISTDGGGTWNDLPPAGGYPDTFAQTQGTDHSDDPVNACGYAYTHGAFTGVSTSASNADPGNGTATAVFKPFTADLASYVGQTVQLRWRFSSDPSTAFSGFYLDQVQLGAAIDTDRIFANGFETAAADDHMCH